MDRPARQDRAVDDPKVEPVLHHHPTRASLRAASSARQRRLAIVSIIVALVVVTLTAGVLYAPAAWTALSSAPTDADLRRSAAVAEEATIAVRGADALNDAVAVSGLDVAAPPVSLDALVNDVRALDHPDDLDAETLASLTARVASATRAVRVDTDDLGAALADARQAEQQRIAAEKAAAEKAAAQAAANTVDGAKATAREIASSRYGWGGDQFGCLDALWTKESGWDYRAYNASSGATGIPQALPGDKMATAGADWRTNAATQISWGLDYIARAYGTPCSAWGHSQATNWY